MRALLVSSLVLAGCQACQPTSLSGVETRWTVTPGQLEFGEVFVGATGTAQVTVQNESRSDLDLVLSVDAPFSVDGPVHLEGGATAVVAVLAQPSGEGDVAAVLRLTDGSRPVEVALHVRGRDVPDCGNATTCRARRFDVTRGECVDEDLPDGTTCTSTCLAAATCHAGICTGAARDCDDRDACTTDSCDEALGCRHDAVTCAPSTDLCLASVCRPLTGCGLEPVADGARCGENDCTTAHVCVEGRCAVRVAPEGSECAPADVCRAASVCESQRCVAGAMTPLVARWTHAPAGKRVFFEGTVSEDGVAWFTEAPIADPLGPLELVGLDEHGVERLRVELEPNCPNCSARLALDPLNGLVFAGRRGRVQARDARDGGLRWVRDTVAGKTPRSPMSDGGGVWSTSAFLSFAADDAIVEQLTEGYELHREYSVALHRLTGAVLWERDWWGHVYFPAVTASHSLFITNADCWAPIQQSQVLDAFGHLERTVPRQARPVGVDGDRVLLVGSDLVWSSPGGVSAPFTTRVGNPTWALSAPGRVVLAGYQSIAELDDDGGTRWLRSAASSLTTGALVDDGGVLYAEYTSDGGSLLRRVTADGALRFTCPLPGSTGNGALVRGLFVAPLSRSGSSSVAAFEVGPIDLAKTGWVTPNGSPRNDRHPLPVLPQWVR